MGVGVGLGILPSSLWQAAAGVPAAALSNSVPITPPAPPQTKSPVDTFRELLAMNTAAERRDFLTNRSPESRELILAKVREYQSLSADQRELRLRATELRWYLLPLMRASSTNRAEQLAAIPVEVRKLVEDRLQLWDMLPPDLQKELLDNEALIQFRTEPGDPKRAIENVPEPRRKKLQENLERWQQMTEEQRQQLIARFDQFFGLTEKEKKKALTTLSEPERRQIEKTLRNYEKLSAAQRAQCVRSFEKFANLSVEERQRFLKNAARWTIMKPEEREAWRNLVNRLSAEPPLPPWILQSPPPLPPGLPLRKATPSVATTNHN